MGYACPVCEAPQADGEHLANHLAFSALLGHADHEAWLDEHAPDWSEADPEGLAAAVTDLAEPVEYQEVFEEASGSAPELVDDPVRGPAGPAGPSSGSLDARTREVIEEAQRLSDGLWRGGTAADAGGSDADEPVEDGTPPEGDGSGTADRDGARHGDEGAASGHDEPASSRDDEAASGHEDEGASGEDDGAAARGDDENGK